MKRLINSILCALTLLCAFNSCALQELVDPMNTHYVRFYLQENIKNVTSGFYNESYLKPEYRTPTVIRLALCDPSTGEVKAERYLTGKGTDSNGKYIDGYIACDGGDYQMLAYNWDTELTMIMNPSNCYQAYAYTNIVETKSAIEVHHAPDFLFVAKDQISTKYTNTLDTLLSSSGKYFDAYNIVETYFVQVPVRNIGGVSEITAVVTGMSGSKLIDTEDISQTPVGVFTSMSRGDIGMDVTNIYATINTFGHIPGATSEVHLIFYMDLTDGTTHTMDIDITHKFQEDDALVNKWIIIDVPIDAPIPDESGGFHPGVGEWEEINSDIPLL